MRGEFSEAGQGVDLDRIQYAPEWALRLQIQFLLLK
jgi:hypothetical protein